MCAIVWTGIDRLELGRHSDSTASNEGRTSGEPTSRPTSRSTWAVLSTCVLALWGVAAVRPWNALERFSDIERPISISRSVNDLDLAVVISNDADGVHWDTGLPAAYTPMPVKPLTGEIVDDVEIYLRIPCPLFEAQGAVVISNDATFSTVNREALDNLTASGALRRITQDQATVYLPTDRACDG